MTESHLGDSLLYSEKEREREVDVEQTVSMRLIYLKLLVEAAERGMDGAVRER